MPFSGNTFTRLYSWVANAALGIKIRSDEMDADSNDIAAGLSTLAVAIANAIASFAAQTGASLSGFIQAATGAVPRTVQDELRDAIKASQFGVVGDGTFVNTAILQAAINAAYGRTLLLQAGTYLTGPLTVSSSLSIQGEAGAVIKFGSGSNTSLITVSGTSTVFKSRGVTYDGNYTAHDGNSLTIRFNAVGTSTVPAVLELYENVFINGDYADISVRADTDITTVEHIKIRNNRFLGGVEGTSTEDCRYIDIEAGEDIDISGNYINFLKTPTTYGRAGIVMFSAGYTGSGSRGTVSNNTLVNVGRSSASGHGTLGAIDGYYGSNSLTVVGNILVTPWGRGIQIKSNAKNVVIAGNSVQGLGDLTGGTSVDAQITVNRSTTTAVGGIWSISSNTLCDSGWDGISVSAANTDISAWGASVVVNDNIVTNASRRGIGLYAPNVAKVSGNLVNGGCSQYGIAITGPVDAVSVGDNTVKNVSGGIDLYIQGPLTFPVDVADNQLLGSTPYSYSGTDAGLVRLSNNSTVAASAVSAYPPSVTATTAQINWASAAPNSTINSQVLGVGSYDVVFEGDCTAIAAAGLFIGLGGGMTATYLRATSQLFNGTTMVNSLQLTAVGGGSIVAYTGACTHYRITVNITVSVAGSLLINGNQNASNATQTSVFQGASMKVTRLS